MLKAELFLNDIKFASYKDIDLEVKWREIPAVRIWLKARGFDLTQPIFVTKDNEENSLIFFQTKSDSGKTLILVHPNPVVRDQLHTSLKNAGHLVHSFKRIKDANVKIKEMKDNNINLSKIIVPAKLDVSVGITYKMFLNKKYPQYQVLTVDDKNYRDEINWKEF